MWVPSTASCSDVSRASRPKKSKRLYSILTVLLSTALTLLALELAFRLMWTPHEAHRILDDRGRNLYMEDERLGHRMLPDFVGRNYSAEFDVTIRTNSQGYRGGEFGRRGRGARRIFAMGDSIVFGYGSDDYHTIPQTIERDLGTRIPRPVEVFNLGCAGYCQGQAVAQLRTELPRQRPEIVLAFFFLGNDADDNLDFMLSRDPQAFPEIPPKPEWSFYKRMRHGIYSHSRLAQFLAVRLWGNLMRWGLVESTPAKEIAYMQKPEQPRVSAGWKATEHYLCEMRDLCNRHGASLLVIALPSKSMVSDDVFTQGAAYYGLDPGDLDRSLPEQRLISICEESGIDFVSLIQPLKDSMGRGEPIFFDVDPHPSPDGLKRIGSLMSQRCLEILHARDRVKTDEFDDHAWRALISEAADRLISIGLALTENPTGP